MAYDDDKSKDDETINPDLAEEMDEEDMDDEDDDLLGGEGESEERDWI